MPGESRHSETRGAGINQQYTRSDEQQDGMRRDGSRWVSCCCYTSRLLCNPPCLLPPRRCCCVLLPPTPPLLARPRRRQPAQPQPPRNPSTLPSFLAQLAQAAQPATQPSRHVVLLITSWSHLAGTSPVTRHPSPVVTRPIWAEKGEARLSRPACCHFPVTAGNDNE